MGGVWKGGREGEEELGKVFSESETGEKTGRGDSRCESGG